MADVTPPAPRDDDAAPDPLQALHELVHSQGYALFLEHVRREYGNAAQIRKVRAALEAHPATEHSILTQSILATSDAVIKLFAWPDEEMERLRGVAGAPAPKTDVFAHHRRIGI